MGIAPAMADWPDTGHHHLLINKPKLNHDKPIPKTDNKKYIHFGKGQTEGEIALEPENIHFKQFCRLFSYDTQSSSSIRFYRDYR